MEKYYELKDSDIGYYFNVTPVMDLDHFVELFIASLGLTNYDIYKKNGVKALMPVNYAEIMNRFMYDARYMVKDENIIISSVAKIINIEDFYCFKDFWFEMLSNSFKKFFEENKDVKKTLKDGQIEITFSNEKFVSIMDKYDEQAKDDMQSFILLLNEYDKENYLENKSKKKVNK